jgi:hypothetical protein
MLLSEIWGLVSVGSPLWREDGSAICSVITEWCSEPVTIRYYLIWDSPSLEGKVPIFISPRNRVAQLYPRALGWLSPYNMTATRRGVFCWYNHEKQRNKRVCRESRHVQIVSLKLSVRRQTSEVVANIRLWGKSKSLYSWRSVSQSDFTFVLSFAGKLLCSSSWGALSGERKSL